ncbi:hypothetical protein LHJ74_14425 [Streptomyces sp. N2-109]|uniref:Uncharacterized protein n=1 Tax=Streptomyces gossypii TaxID=2883101 RepID=A0ABT2JT73_9ACTN|nr:hypothetical protein [Streptomyces gossypii]MCT2591089.1 hypothetical protein [Streptomyces gossypii]
MSAPSAAEVAALKVAHAAAPDAPYELLRGIVSTLGSAQLIQTPETAARAERHRLRLVAAEADLMAIRGTLAPSGRPRRVPMPLGARVAPVVEWLADEVAQLRARVAQLVQQRDDLLVEDALAERDTAAPPQNPVSLRWGLGDVEYVDDDSVTVLLSGPSGEPYVLELDEARAAELWADLTGPDAVGTRKCGHDDYHDGHPWADRPGIWCPGHYTTVDAERAACCDLHQADCCDPEDCGPCCRACPTCPAYARQRAEIGGAS